MIQTTADKTLVLDGILEEPNSKTLEETLSLAIQLTTCSVETMNMKNSRKKIFKKRSKCKKMNKKTDDDGLQILFWHLTK